MQGQFSSLHRIASSFISTDASEMRRAAFFPSLLQGSIVSSACIALIKTQWNEGQSPGKTENILTSVPHGARGENSRPLYIFLAASGRSLVSRALIILP